MAAICLTAAGLAGCGSSNSPTAQPTTESAPAATQSQAPSSAAEPEETATAAADWTKENFAQRITQAQMKAGTAHVTQVGATDFTVEADVQIPTASTALAMDVTVTADAMGTQRVIASDGVFYVSADQVAPGKWFKMGVSESGADELQDLLAEVDPNEQITRLDGAILEFSAQPDAAVIDDVSTTRIDLVVDTYALTQDSELEGSGTAAMVFYVGPDDLPRRQTTTLDGTEITMDFSRWGEPVNVTVPGEDELVDISSLM